MGLIHKDEKVEKWVNWQYRSYRWLEDYRLEKRDTWFNEYAGKHSKYKLKKSVDNSSVLPEEPYELDDFERMILDRLKLI